jgi:hypothetical protein
MTMAEPTSIGDTIITWMSILSCLIARGFKWTSSVVDVNPKYVPIIDQNGLSKCSPLREVIFTFYSHVKKSRGLYQCTSLHRFAIPPSIDVISPSAFSGYTSLSEIIFTSKVS